MSRSTSNTTPSYSPLPPRLAYHDPWDDSFGNFGDDNDPWAFEGPLVPLYDNFHAPGATRRGASDSRRPSEGTVALARPLDLSGSAPPPGSRIHVLFLGNELATQTDPWRTTREIIGNQWNTAATPPRLDQLDSKLTHNEQKRALQKLKKEIYNPFRRISQRVNLYYRDTVVKENEMENNENGKRCAICLEDFEPRQEVMITPCKHMFHEECIVPWVKSNGHCPVCRFAM